MAGGPFLLSEEEQDEENRRQLANFAADQMDGQRQAFGLAPAKTTPAPSAAVPSTVIRSSSPSSPGRISLVRWGSGSGQ